MTTYPKCASVSLFGIFAPEPENATIVHNIGYGTYNFDSTIAGLSVIGNRIANATATNGQARIVQTTFRTFRVVATHHDFRAIPLVILIILGFITSTSVAVLYPTEERINNVRSLQYCNGVSPAALWIAYLLYDMQVLILGVIVTYVCIFASVSGIWLAPGYVFGVMILFGIATYLGLYVLSFFINKAAFAIATALHIVLFVLYLVGYVVTSSGSAINKYEIYSQIQYGVGLTSPAANLARAMFISINNYDVTCGQNAMTNPVFNSFNLYTDAYINLLVQIVFLAVVIGLLEYGSTEWFYRLFWRKHIPARLQYVVDSNSAPIPEANFQEQEKKLPSAEDGAIDIANTAISMPVLIAQRVSKYFGKLFATENVSFNIASNEVLALIGPNGAGKTTVINMIRGILKPNYGDIHLDGISVLEQPQRAREAIGVCPQDDAVDELTMRQTLNFYAAVKGLKDVKRNVDTILEAFNISEFANVPVKKLSGGTRRKLMVSIALLGNPRVLLLDEPSTGQDAGAKRVLWKVLQSLRHGRAILLTTHSMEETEALATKVTILSTRVLASGSLAGLRNEYGGQYHIRATYGADQNEGEIRRTLGERFGSGMTSLTVRYGEAEFEVPHVTRELGTIMEKMEGMVIGGEVIGTADGGDGNGAGGATTSGRVFSEYVVMEPTMQEVFMKVCQRASLTTLADV
jgi:ATP-binding cassette subfamily A (ABC1) protein 3